MLIAQGILTFLLSKAPGEKFFNKVEKIFQFCSFADAKVRRRFFRPSASTQTNKTLSLLLACWFLKGYVRCLTILVYIKKDNHYYWSSYANYIVRENKSTSLYDLSWTSNPSSSRIMLLIFTNAFSRPGTGCSLGRKVAIVRNSPHEYRPRLIHHGRVEVITYAQCSRHACSRRSRIASTRLRLMCR